MDDLINQSTSPKYAVKLIRKLRGSSQAVLIECDDGHHYIVKMVGSPQGPNTLANEWLGAILSASVDLPVAKTQFVYMSASFLASNQSHKFHALGKMTRTKPGLHIGSQCAGELTGPNRIIQYLPRAAIDSVTHRTSFLGMYLFDIWAEQRFRRKMVFRKTAATSGLEPVFIGHSRLFGGSEWNSSDREYSLRLQGETLYSGLWSSRAVKSWIRIFRKRIPDALSLAIDKVPSHWYVGNLGAVQVSLLARLDDLPNLAKRYSALDGLLPAGGSSDEVI